MALRKFFTSCIPYSLTTRLLCLFFIVMMIPLLLVGTLEYSTAQKILKEYVFILIIFTGCIMGILLWFLVVYITRPIKKLMQCTEEITKGHFGHLPLLNSQDEIGQLSKSFFVMSEHLKTANQENQKRSWLQSGLIQLNMLLRSELTINDLSESIIEWVCQYIRIAEGQLWLRVSDSSENSLEKFAQYPYKKQQCKYSKRTYHIPLILQGRLIGKMTLRPEMPLTWLQGKLVALTLEPIAACLHHRVLYQQIEQADEYKSEFLANIFYQLRPSIANIEQLSKKLLTESQQHLSEKQVLQINEIEKNTRELLKKVNTLFSFSKREAKKLNVLPEMFQSLPQHILENAGEGIVSINTKGKITFSNLRACELIETNKEHLLNQDIQHIFDDATVLQCLARWKKAKNDNDISAFDQQHIFLTKISGNKTPVECSVAPLLNHKKHLRGGVLIFQDITQRKQEEERLLHDAHHDSLTGLANRIILKQFIHSSIARNHRKHKNTALIFLDLDNFKEVNDTLGHEVGDFLLNHVAKRLKACIRKSDLIARLGGDEFVIVLDEVVKRSTICSIADKIIQALTRTFYVHQEVIGIGVSIGIAVWPENGSSPEELMKAADHAMYQAKQKGGNSFCFYDERSALP